ncbi:MAG TPA: tryptophan 2,3-dioxygenase family protein [Gemmatimonadaceae bacterium]|nr:tryptophan 2,3-dioxygenase family protein [Gemmatimonadaceae bacterium]
MTDSSSSHHQRAGDREISYPSYLALDELLSLQRPVSRPEHPDELLFIVVHQSSELWFKVILHELDTLVQRLEAEDVLGATFSVRRLNALMRIVTDQLSALDTLPPQRFAEFRGYLGTSSGSQSSQFRAIEAASGLREPNFIHVISEHGEPADIVKRWLERPTLQALFERLLSAKHRTLEEVYSSPEPSDLLMLAEELLAYEQQFARWRFLHVQLVERIIGPGTMGTGGTLGARYLSRTVSQRFFPNLWDVRSRFFGSAPHSG